MSGECEICGIHPVDGNCECDITHNVCPNTVECTIDPKVQGEIQFRPNSDTWAMKLTESGIEFNREKYPYSDPVDFAQAVIDILENEFSVKFERKSPPYDRT